MTLFSAVTDPNPNSFITDIPGGDAFFWKASESSPLSVELLARLSSFIGGHPSGTDMQVIIYILKNDGVLQLLFRCSLKVIRSFIKNTITLVLSENLLKLILM